MELLTLAPQDLHFPKTEWQWLRPKEETLFLLGVRCGFAQNQIWAWSPKGGELDKELFLEDGVPVLILQDCFTEEEAYFLYLKTSFQFESPQESEWTHACILLAERFPASLEKDQRFSRIFGMNLWSKIPQRLKFNFLTLPEKHFLFAKKWDPSFFEYFRHLEKDLRTEFLEAITTLGLSANHVKECSNLLLIIAKKYSPKAALDLCKKNHKSADEFRNTLFQIAQPELFRLSDERLQKIRKLHLPPRTSVFSDPSFEKDSLKITHMPKNLSDWEVFKDWVNHPETVEKISGLLDLYQNA